MKNYTKFIGGILLIIGTSLGGGMLALPIGTAASGLFNTTIALLLCWVAMTICAFFILEVNLYLPRGANMISMAQVTLGVPGKAVTWISYLCLLYTLLSAYIAGGSDLFESFLTQCNIQMSAQIATLIYVCFFAGMVYCGIRLVDRVNSILMYLKLAVYCLLLFLIAPKVNIVNLQGGDWLYLKNAFLLLIASFGFAIIVPTLRDYFEDDIKQLRQVILLGSLFPLFCYLAWIAVIMGVVPKEGANGLMTLVKDAHATSGLAHALEVAVQQPTISRLFEFFSSISMLTAFLGVSLCLFDFLSDGLHMEKKGKQGYMIAGLVFVPPTLVVLVSPNIYIQAIAYAGMFCVVLLILLPALMVYVGRYVQRRDQNLFVTPGGKISVVSVLIFSLILLINAFF